LTSAIGIAQYAGWFGLDLPSSGMPSSTFGYRNFAAGFTIAAIPFVALEIVRRSRLDSRICWSLLLFLNGTFLLATRSRAAWAGCVLSLVVALIAVVWKLRHQNRISALGLRQSSLMISGAVGLALIFSATVPHRMQGAGFDAHSTEKATLSGTIDTTFEPGADKDRFTMWRHTLEMIQASPFSGVGLGNWQYVYPYFDQGDVTWKGATPQRPHNDYLWIAAETGVLGLGIFVWLMISTGALAIRTARRVKDQATFLQILASIASPLAISVHCVFSFPLERIPVTFLGTIGLSILVASDPVPRSRVREGRFPGFVWLIVAVTQLLAATVVWRATKFDRLAYLQSAAVTGSDWVGAIRFGTDALAAGVFDPQVLLLRGLSHHMSGQFDLAIEDQERCLSYHPYFVNAINNLGMSLNAAGRFDDRSWKSSLSTGHLSGDCSTSRTVGLG
jgi:hypothetical protein